MDHWSAFGVTENVTGSSSRDVEVVMIKNGAHHVDLSFSSPSDTPDIVEARGVELRAIRRWIQAAFAAQQH